MRGIATSGAACVLGSGPLGCLLLLLLTHSVAVGPGLAAMAVITVFALLLGFVWARDMDALVTTLRAAVQENELALSRAAALPRLPAVERVARGIERLARAHAARAAEIGALLRANVEIVEHLPDPLLVLGADHGVRRANAAARLALGAELGAVLPDRTRDRAVERMRADFVANASHELRTPLASLMGFIETLRGPAADDPPAQQLFLGIMAEQAERMNRLIDDLLSLSRIELTEHQPPADAADLPKIIESIAAGFEPRLA